MKYIKQIILYEANYHLPMGYILSVNEKLPVSNIRYFGKYIIVLFGYCYFHVSGLRQDGLER